ncbi:MAG: hypothetical protein LUG99_00425 [Lachnospiraceae bacterium]|nr:hypothetical protein [Lachnospiraceae bacterium]
MGYVCVKGLTCGGKAYKPGEMIPDGVILNSRVRALKSTGHIAETDGTASTTLVSTEEIREASLILIVVSSEDGTEKMEVPISQEGLQVVFDVMQMAADEATKAIGQIGSEEELILLNAADSRAAVKKAAKKRAESLTDTQSE